MSRKSLGRIGSAVAATLAAVSAVAAPNTVRRDFDGDTAGAEPAFFRYEGTPGLPSERWKAIPDAQAYSKSQVGVQTVSAGQPGQFHFALSTQAGELEDGTVQAVTRAVARGVARAGIVARYAGPSRFIAALVDFHAQTVTLVSMRDGKAVPLGSGAIQSTEPVWRTVRMELSGKTIKVSVSGHVAIEAQDPDPRPGRAGLVAEAPVPVSFDDLEIETK
jgi:hypothetical protein